MIIEERTVTAQATGERKAALFLLCGDCGGERLN